MSEPRRRSIPVSCTRPARTVVAVLASLLFTLLPLHAFASGGPAEQTLESLRAADRLRQEQAREAQAWLEERARLELLLGSLREQTEAWRQREGEATRRLRAARAAAPPPPEAILAQLESGADRVTRQIHEALDLLALRVPPGLVPPRKERARTPKQGLDEALHRLERAERATGEVEVSVVSGVLDGELRSVELLRFGGVAAWWQGLDGQAGGEAVMHDARLQLLPATDVAELEAIARASAVAKGRQAPEILLLPVAHARTSTGGPR